MSKYCVWGFLPFVLLLLLTACNGDTEPMAQATSSPTPSTLGGAYPPPALATTGDFDLSGYPAPSDGVLLASPTPLFTRTPRPTPLSTNTPTMTPIPTALALQSSNYLAIWVDVVSADFEAEDANSVFWSTDPVNVGQKQELFRVTGPVYNPSLSSNGRYIAFSALLPETSEVTVWMFDLIDKVLIQLPLPGVSYIYWHPSDLTFTFATAFGENYYATIETFNIETGERNLVMGTQATDPLPDLSVLGWSANGTSIYYQRGYLETWRADLGVTVDSEKLFPSGFQPILSTDGSAFLFQHDSVISYFALTQGQNFVSEDVLKELLNQQKSVEPISQGFTWIWSPTAPIFIYTQWEQERWDAEGSSDQRIFAYEISTQTSEELGSIEEATLWDFISISPDFQWLIMENQREQEAKLDLLYLETGITTFIYPTKTHSSVFVGWINKQ